MKRRCPYCGRKCKGRVCYLHHDLLDLDPHKALPSRLMQAENAARTAEQRVRDEVRKAAREGRIFDSDYVTDLATGRLLVSSDEVREIIREEASARGEKVSR